jgi:hypothetical protein
VLHDMCDHHQVSAPQPKQEVIRTRFRSCLVMYEPRLLHCAGNDLSVMCAVCVGARWAPGPHHSLCSLEPPHSPSHIATAWERVPPTRQACMGAGPTNPVTCMGAGPINPASKYGSGPHQPCYPSSIGA